MADRQPDLARVAIQVAPFHPKLIEALDAMYPSEEPEQRPHRLLTYLKLREKRDHLERESHVGFSTFQRAGSKIKIPDQTYY
jgi:hypothetical protein